MKTRDGSKTPLTLAFRFAETAENGWQTRMILSTGNSTKGRFGTGSNALHLPSFPPCLIPAVDGIFRPGGGRSGAFQGARENLAG
jgi:hypothetical protein